MTWWNRLGCGAAACMLAAGCGVFGPGDGGGNGSDDEGAFSYAGRTGPEFWGSLHSDYTPCGSGSEQSPINIVTADATVDTNLPALAPDYHDVEAVLINNGHTLEVEYHEGSTVTFDGKEFELLQFHFHWLSEHRINGVPSDMEAHLVHRSADGDLLVIGILINAGAENAFLAQFWEEFEIDESEKETQIEINVADLLPADLNYYAYDGSLTTPPCSEIVTWVVLKTPIEMSRAQIDQFVSIIGNNYRPVQDLDGRAVATTN